MSDFLARVARRAAGPGSVARLRPRARFERSDSAPVLQPTDAGVRAGQRAAAVEGPDGPEVPEVLGRPEAGPRAFTEAPERVTSPATPSVQAAARRPEAGRPAARRPGSPDPVPAQAADAAAAAPLRVADPRPEPARAARRQVPRGDLNDRPPTAGPRPQVDGRMAPAADVPATDELLARHVVPALVDAGLLGDDDVSIVREPASVPSSAPAPGARPVVRVVEEPAMSRSGGDVHVHIARVEVVTPGPRPGTPARARAPRPPAVDHEAYLAARRGERS